jgi:hypothetical protein
MQRCLPCILPAVIKKQGFEVQRALTCSRFWRIPSNSNVVTFCGRLTYQLRYHSATVSLLHVRSDDFKWPYSTPVRLLFTVCRVPKQPAGISGRSPPPRNRHMTWSPRSPNTMRGISKQRFESTELKKWIGGGSEGEKQTIQVGMPRKVRENLSLESKHAWTGCRPSSIHFQKYSCDTNILTVCLTLETLRREVLYLQ